MRSRFWCANFSKRKKSCIRTGPIGPALMLFWLSATGMPLMVVSVGRLAMKSFLCASDRDPGNPDGLRRCQVFFHNTPCVREQPGVNGNLGIRLAMTLVALL